MAAKAKKAEKTSPVGDRSVNGSVAILIPKDKTPVTNEQCLYFSSEEYRKFYQIARNYQTRSLNVDACSVFYYGLLRDEPKKKPITEKLAFGEQIAMFDVE